MLRTVRGCLIWDNATCHPETLQASLINIKLTFQLKNGDKQMSAMLNELIRKMKTLKLQNFRQNTIHIFFRKWSCKLSQLTYNIVRFLFMIIFFQVRPKLNFFSGTIGARYREVWLHYTFEKFRATFHSHPSNMGWLQCVDVNNPLQKVFKRVYTVYTYSNRMIYQMICCWKTT